MNYQAFSQELLKIALSREVTQAYYEHPLTQERVLPQLLRKNVAIRMRTDKGNILKRNRDGKPLRMMRNQGQRPDSYQYWVKRRANEILPEYGATSDHLLIDVDPGPKVNFQNTKKITESVRKRMQDTPGVDDVCVNFTGGRGFHVKGYLKKPLPIDKARKRSTELASSFSSQQITTGIRKNRDQVRLDTTPLKRRGILRTPWTLNQETGLVAVPVKNVPSFSLADAKVERALS